MRVYAQYIREKKYRIFFLSQGRCSFAMWCGNCHIFNVCIHVLDQGYLWEEDRSPNRQKN